MITCFVINIQWFKVGQKCLETPKIGHFFKVFIDSSFVTEDKVNGVDFFFFVFIKFKISRDFILIHSDLSFQQGRYSLYK